MGAPVGFFLVDAATDPDAGNVLTYKIVADDSNGKFAIDPASGQVYVSRAGAWVSRNNKPLAATSGRRRAATRCLGQGNGISQRTRSGAPRCQN